MTDRPHRLARLVDVPAVHEVVRIELLEKLASEGPRVEPQEPSSPKQTGGWFDLDQWLAEHRPWFAERKIEIIGPTAWNGGRRYILSVCAWNPEHRDKSGYIVQFANGAIAAGCLHRSCEGNEWHALRDLIEPRWRIDSAQHKDEAWAEWKIPFQTAADIAAETPEKVEWIAFPWVAKGTLTEVAGKIKAAGKTTFVTHMVAAVLDGDHFMGQPTSKTPVVYLNEQPRMSLRQALAKAHLLERRDLFILCWHDVMIVPWVVIARKVTQECIKRNAKLLVVDTGPQFAKLVGDSENNAGDALQAIQPLQEAVAVGSQLLSSGTNARVEGALATQDVAVPQSGARWM